MTEKEPPAPSQSKAARFEAIFKACYPRVLAYGLRRTSDRSAAEEVASETFLIAWRRLDVVPLEALPWLLGTARKVLANQRRSTGRRMPDGPLISLEFVTDASPRPSIPELVADRQAFATAFAALSPGDREVLALVAWEGLEPREAAPVVGCSAATFSLRLHRARRRLMKELKANGHSLGEQSNRSAQGPQPGAAEAQ